MWSSYTTSYTIWFGYITSYTMLSGYITSYTILSGYITCYTMWSGLITYDLVTSHLIKCYCEDVKLKYWSCALWCDLCLERGRKAPQQCPQGCALVPCKNKSLHSLTAIDVSSLQVTNDLYTSLIHLTLQLESSLLQKIHNQPTNQLVINRSYLYFQIQEKM